MAIVILGGLVTSTLLNLFVLPSLYLRFGKSKRVREVHRMPEMRKLHIAVIFISLLAMLSAAACGAQSGSTKDGSERSTTQASNGKRGGL